MFNVCLEGIGGGDKVLFVLFIGDLSLEDDLGRGQVPVGLEVLSIELERLCLANFNILALFSVQNLKFRIKNLNCSSLSIISSALHVLNLKHAVL